MSSRVGAPHSGARAFVRKRTCEVAAATLIVATVWLAGLLRTVLAGKTVPWDAKNQFYAFFVFLARSLHEGTSFLWNPYHYGGHPSVADPQSLIFSPVFLVWAAFDRAPSMLTFDVLVWLHLLAGGLAMTAIGARRGWPVSAMVVAAVLFMLGGAASGRLQHSGIIVAYAMFPLALLLLESALSKRSLAAGLAFAGIASVILLARNQVALLECLALAAYGLSMALVSGEGVLAYIRRRTAVLATIVTAGAAIVVIPLLLTLQLAALSSRPSETLEVALLASLHPANLLSMAVANVFGALDQSYDYWGPQGAVTPSVSATDESFNYLFCGMAPVIVLTWLGLASGRLLARDMRFWTFILVAAMLFSLGRYTPVFPFIFEHVPGFAFFRRPIDGMFLAGIAIAMLTGQLVSDFARRGRPRASWFGSAAAVIAIGAVAAAALSVASATGHVIASLEEAAASLPLATIVVVALAWASTPGHRRMATAVIACVTVGELLLWNTASRLNAEPEALYQALREPKGEERVALDILPRELARRRKAGERPRVEIVGLGGAWQNLAMAHDIEATNGYNPLRIGIYDRLIQPGESAAFSEDRKFTRAFSGYGCALARARGIEYLVVDQPIEQLRELSLPRGIEILHGGPNVWSYRFSAAMPRGKFHSRIEVTDADALLISGALSHPPENDKAVIDDETPPARSVWAVAAGARGEARIVDWRPDRVTIDISAVTPGVLVLHDLYYPGWTATLDGVDVRLLRADALFRGVETPAGRHRVVFEFAPFAVRNLIDAARQILGLEPHRAPATPTLPEKGSPQHRADSHPIGLPTQDRRT